MRQAARDCFEARFEIKKAAETLHAVLAGSMGVNSPSQRTWICPAQIDVRLG